MAFFGLLRSSEYTSPKINAHNSTTLMFEHVVASPSTTMMFIRLQASKTDPFRKGVTIRLHRIDSPFCPVQAAQNFIRAHPSHRGPFFQYQDGSFLTRNRLSAILQAAFPLCTNINTHSFRIGGASIAAAHGIPDYVIQIMGRWSSDCFRQYIRLPDANLANYQQTMSNPSSSTIIWDADTLSSRNL